MLLSNFICLMFASTWDIGWVVPPPRMPVTTRTITFLVGDPYKLSFATVTGKGDNPRYWSI